MKNRNRVPNLDSIGKKPGQPRKSAGRRLEEPPEEAFLTPGERGRSDIDDDDEPRPPRREQRSRERPSN